ncbi:hypothetical protein F511_29620 [Dorcoceras hygrometricum]|uniref:Uncharacterized protein n=1 Tax=Dorcoceras hygrometricum TaxID=472368 RepID=A0A2Z7C0B0_9LAMI|nr:hypothetical protein F511_29620 [Dorcoceras hygrometricum]
MLLCYRRSTRVRRSKLEADQIGQELRVEELGEDRLRWISTRMQADPTLRAKLVMQEAALGFNLDQHGCELVQCPVLIVGEQDV